jgi:TPR repeat protein
MKIKTASFLFFAALLFICLVQLTGCQTPKKTAPIVQESWETISNRWGSVSLEKVTKIAKHGDVTAQYYLGGDAVFELALMYEKGEGVQTNLSEARNLIIQDSIAINLGDGSIASLEGGQPDACFRVGQWYENGDGVPRDDYRATKYYYNSAAGNVTGKRRYKNQAAENLLKLYAEGRGLSKTNQEPEDYLDRELVDKNTLVKKLQYEITTARAEFYVGKIYYQGTLVSQDLVEAAARFQVAADEGSEDAKQILLELEPKISTSQKEAVSKRVLNLKTNLRISRMMQ